MNNRKEQANEKYRKLFEELGLNSSFEYVRFEKKDALWFRCKRCGSEFSRCNDIFKGRQNKLVCPTCKNGTKRFSEIANKAMDYYQNGHSAAETAEKFKLTTREVKDFAKHRHISNGRIFGKCSNDDRMKKTEEVARSVSESMNLVIFWVWQGVDKYYPVINTRTGEVLYMRGSRFTSSRCTNRKIAGAINIRNLIERDGNRCYICGKEMNLSDRRWGNYGPDYPTVDHIRPLSKGGKNDLDNVRICCGLCNLRKGAKYEEITK